MRRSRMQALLTAPQSAVSHLRLSLIRQETAGAKQAPTFEYEDSGLTQLASQQKRLSTMPHCDRPLFELGAIRANEAI